MLVESNVRLPGQPPRRMGHWLSVLHPQPLLTQQTKARFVCSIRLPPYHFSLPQAPLARAGGSRMYHGFRYKPQANPHERAYIHRNLRSWVSGLLMLTVECPSVLACGTPMPLAVSRTRPQISRWTWHNLPRCRGFNGKVHAHIKVFTFRKPAWYFSRYPSINHLRHNALSRSTVHRRACEPPL